MIKNNDPIFDLVNKTGNHLINSSFSKFYKNTESSTYSIKIPVNGGQEFYNLDRNNYIVKPGSFLLVNNGDLVESIIDSKVNVFGKCIYIDKNFFNNIYHDIIHKDYFFERENCSGGRVISGKYFISNNNLGKFLNEFLQRQNEINLNEEWYTELSYNIIVHQLGLSKILSKLKIQNESVKLEIYRRLEIAKSYLIENYNENVSLDSLSKTIGISKFHLIRLFKVVYGNTPYKFLLKIRLNKAFEQLKKNNDLSIEEIALANGFNQRRTFTRSFKKEFGISPIKLINPLLIS